MDVTVDHINKAGEIALATIRDCRASFPDDVDGILVLLVVQQLLRDALSARGLI